MKKWTRTRLLVGVSLGLSLPGAAHSQILYNEKLDAQAKAAMTEYQTMRDAHLAMLKDREAAIKALSDRMDSAVIAAVRAERDREVVGVLARAEAGTAGVPARRAALDALLVRRIEQLSGLTMAQLKAPSAEQRQLLDRAGIGTTGMQEEAYRPAIVFDEGDAASQMGEHHDLYFVKPKAAQPSDGKLQQGSSPREGRRPKPGAAPGGSTPEPPKAEPFSYAKFCETVPDIHAKSNDQQERDFDALMADARLQAIPEGPRNSVALRLIYQICPSVHHARRQMQFLADASVRDANALKALAGIGFSHAALPLSTGPDLTETLEAIDLGLSIQQLRTDLDAAKTGMKGAQEELRRLKQEQKALNQAMKGSSAEDVAAAAARIVEIIGKPPAPPATPPAALAGGGAAATTDTATAAAPSAADPCLGPITLACGRQIAEKYGLASFDRARESALVEIAALLADPKARADAAKANCGPPGADVSDEQMANATRICLTRSAMDLLGVGDRAADIAAGRPGELAALAVRTADAQMRVAVAEAKAAALTRRLDNLNAQRAALVNELNILLRAKAHLDDKGSDYRVALLDFGRSVDQGRLAYERASEQFTLIALNDFAAREEQMVKGRYALIDGLLTTITSSTGAGIKPAELGSFFSAIGFTTLGIAEAAQ